MRECLCLCAPAVEEKVSELKRREDDQRTRCTQADRAIAAQYAPGQQRARLGCGNRICRSLARLVGLVPLSNLNTVELEAAFGARKPTFATSKLEAASSALQTRVDTLERRAEQHMKAVRDAIRTGKRDVAARELRKAKTCQRQAESSRAVLDAMEAQTDMMEQNALQREVASALAGTAKTMKRDKKLLEKAEDAVDNAAELRDLNTELTQIMAGLAEPAAELDDDELSAELDAIVEASRSPPAPAPDPDIEAEMARKAEALQKKHEAYEEAQRIRAIMPRAPGNARVERTALLSQSHA